MKKHVPHNIDENKIMDKPLVTQILPFMKVWIDKCVKRRRFPFESVSHSIIGQLGLSVMLFVEIY